MNNKKSDIISIILGTLLVCFVFIPVGAKNGWTTLHTVISSIIFLATVIIGSWNIPALKPPKFYKKPKRILLWASYFLMITGTYFLIGPFGNEYLFLAIGGILLLGGVGVERYIVKTSCNSEEENKEE